MRSYWTSMKLRPVLAFAAAGSLGALTGCVVINKDHCAYAMTPCAGDLVCSACAIDNNGCVAPATIQDQMCLVREGSSTGGSAETTSEPSTTGPTTTTSPTGSTSTSDPTVSTEPITSEATTMSGSDSTDTTDTTTTTGMDICLGDVVVNDCGGDKPYCVDMACVSCEALSSCAEFEPSKPACEVKSGLCVECLTSNDCVDVDNPACNAETATCGPCTEHEQCPGTACNLESGQCFPSDNILYVNNDINICSDKVEYGLTKAMPLCSLFAALKRAVINKPLTIRLQSSVKPQTIAAGLQPGPYTVAIVSQDTNTPTLQRPNDFPALSLLDGNIVFTRQILISSKLGIGGPAVDCVGATLWLDRQKIVSNDVAVHAENCLLHLRRTVIFGNTGGGLDIEGNDPAKSTVWLENSYVTENNGDTFGGLRLAGSASAKIVYSTIALNKSIVPPIDCVLGGGGKVEVRNSAIVDAGAHFGPNCKPTVTNTWEEAVTDKNVLKGTTFGGFTEGVYTALGGGQLKDKAVWLMSDPVADYDGTLRPTPPNPPADYAGADRPPM
jgi:hypothetical protein